MATATTSGRAATTTSETVLAHTLDRWCAHHWRDGLQVTDVAALERVFVRTRNHRYEIIVLDPARAEVLVRGGHYFPNFARARLSGSSMGGGFLKLYGIYPGFCLELQTDHIAIVTSPVREIARATDLQPA